MSFATRHEDMIQNLRDNIAIVQAFKDGVAIEGRPITAGRNNVWKEVLNDHFINFERFEYRLKPLQREAFMVTDPGDEENFQFFLDRKEAEDFAEELAGEQGETSGIVRKFIEVLE